MKVYNILKEWYDTLRLQERIEAISRKFEEWTGLEPEKVVHNHGIVSVRKTLDFDELGKEEQALVKTIAREYGEVERVLKVIFFMKETTTKEGHDWRVATYTTSEINPAFRAVERYKREGGYYYSIIIEFKEPGSDC